MNACIKYPLVRKSFFCAFLIFYIAFSSSCKKSLDEIPEPNPKPETPVVADNVTVNKWVTDSMRVYYYWNQAIPDNNSLDFTKEPKAFFNILRNKDDRFSWIDDETSELDVGITGVSRSTGLDIDVVQGANNAVFGYMRYVDPNSPAEKAGIKRGVFFTKVNGKEMNTTNYKSVLKPYYDGVNLKLQLAKLVQDTTVVNGVVKVTGKIVPTSEVDLIAEKTPESSVYLHKIITTPAGRKVGYLFYNHFLNDKSDELFNAFQDFKSQGAQDLILDIRYNLGGGIAVSGLLSALIMENYSKGNVFAEYSYNNDLNARFDAQYKADPFRNSSASRKKTFIDLYNGMSKKATKNTADSINNLILSTRLNLPRVFILATGSSASASELVINNLRPYIEVVHIGKRTVGKNEGSIKIEDERVPKIINWIIQPIILKLANKDHFGDYAKGLFPTIDVEEGYDLKPHGDSQDPLVKEALKIIEPTMFIQARGTSITLGANFKKIQEVENRNRKAKPVSVDGTVDKSLVRRLN